MGQCSCGRQGGTELWKTRCCGGRRKPCCSRQGIKELRWAGSHGEMIKFSVGVCELWWWGEGLKVMAESM